MRLRVLIAAVSMVLAIVGPVLGQTPFRPVAVVNDAMITGFDLAQRARILASLGYPATNQEQLQTEALDQLIEDKLKLQAGEEIGITPTPDMVTTGIEQYANPSGLTPAEFRARLKAQGVTDQALDDMVIAQMVWLNVIRSRFGGRVEPGEAEIEAELAQRTSQATTEYRVLEIGLAPQASGRSEAETRALAERLSASLNQGGDFLEAVARYSVAPSAERGGEIGWITTGSMPPEMRQTLLQLEIGEVSAPLQVLGGISIIKLVDKRQIATVPSADSGTHDAVRNALIAQRSERLAEGLLQEMRRDALIEVR